MSWKEEDVKAIIRDPIYALGDEPVVDPDTWIEANAKLIQEDGVEAYLLKLLQILDERLDVANGDIVTF